MRIVRWLLVLLLLLVALAGVLVWTAPAPIAYRLLRGHLGTVELAGLSGSAWQGRAEQVAVAAVPLGALDWSLDKAPLLGGVLHGTATLVGKDLEARAMITAGKEVLTLEDLHVQLPASALAPALDIPALVLLGRIELDVDFAEIRAGMLHRAQGTAHWRELGISGGTAAMLPGLGAEFRDAPGGGIAADVHDLGGPLAVNGKVLIVDGRFTSETTLLLREDNPQIAELLKFIGERTPDGGSLLRIEGELRPLW